MSLNSITEECVLFLLQQVIHRSGFSSVKRNTPQRCITRLLSSPHFAPYPDISSRETLIVNARPVSKSFLRLHFYPINDRMAKHRGFLDHKPQAKGKPNGTQRWSWLRGWKKKNMQTFARISWLICFLWFSLHSESLFGTFLSFNFSSSVLWFIIPYTNYDHTNPFKRFKE